MSKKSTSKAGRVAKTKEPVLKIENVIERVSALMARHGLVELEWEDGRERLRLCKHAGQPYPTHMIPAPMVPVAPAAPAVPGPVKPAAKAAAPAEDSNQKKILAPFVGTFYRASAPGAKNYVEQGQTVKKGDVLCIIEAMKLMNELECEYTGKIVSILVENGQPVEFGEPLFVIEA